MKRFSTQKMLATGIGIIVLTIALILFISVRQSQRVRSTVRLVDHTEEVLHHIQKIINTALDNETGARGFVITANENFLGSLRNSETNFIDELKLMRQLVAGNPLQLAWTDTLQYYIGNRIAFSNNMVEVRKEEGLAAAAAMVENGTGKFYTDNIRRTLNEMEKIETDLLAKRKQQSDATISQLNSTMYVALGSVLLLSGIIVRRVKADINRQKESEEKFSALLDAAPDATVIVNEEGRIKMINKQTEKLFHYTRNEIIDQPVEILIPSNLKAKHIFHRNNFSRSADARSMGAGMELNALKKNGNIFPVEISLSPIQTKDGMLISASVRDITERKKAAEQIAHMAKLMEDTSEAVFSTSLSFTIKTWNKAAEKLYGLTAKEVIGKPVAEIVRPQINEATRTKIRREMKETGYWKGEVTHLKKDGTPLFLLVSNTATRDVNGALEGFVNVCRDISERKRNEEEIKQLNATLERRVEEKTHEIIASEKQLRQTLDNMLEGAQIIGFDWKYKYVNDSMTRHGKYSKEEMIGHTVMEKYPGIENTEIFKIYQRCFDERISIHLENEFIFPDKTKGWFELSFQPVPEGIFILSMDITERKKAEAEIIKLNTELEEKVVERTAELQLANKELESFTYSVSHDLRAPLRIIDGYADILKTDYETKLDADGNRVLGIIKTNARRMGQLIDDLLNLSQVGRKELIHHQCDMNKMVKEIIDEQLAFSTKKVSIKMANLDAAQCDSSLIRQVWINLISNAIKYSSKQEQPEVEIRSDKSDDTVTYSISDNGVGFDMKYSEKLFGVFQRLHKVTEFEGTGIGLALVNRILAKHKGRIWAHSEVGKGATFYFSLRV